jgi:hypothetical protein
VQASNASERTVLDLFASINAKSYEQAVGLLHEEISWTLMLVGMEGAGMHTGRDAVLRNVIAGAAGFFREGDPKSQVTSIVSSGDFVMAETHGTGKRFDGLPYDNHYAWAIELRDGLIFRVREYMDSLYVSKFFDVQS